MKEFMIGFVIVAITITAFIFWIKIFAWTIKKYTGLDNGWEYAIAITVTIALGLLIPFCYIVGTEILK
jgi:hypothetical protein